MKFHKNDIIKMGGTAIITALLIAGVNLFTSGGPTFSLAGSQRISLREARTLGAEYKEFRNHLKVRYDDNSTPPRKIIDTLEAFKIKADQLDEIINHNRNPRGGDSTADYVIFYFGKAGGFRYGGADRANMHIIAIGLKNDTLMINPERANDQAAASVFDKASPCPGSPGCPPIGQ